MSYGPDLTIECFPYTRNVAKLKFQIHHVLVKSCNISVIYVQRVTLASYWPVILLIQVLKFAVYVFHFTGSCHCVCVQLDPNMEIILWGKCNYNLLLRPSIYGSGRYLIANEMRHYLEKFRIIPSTPSGTMAGKFKLELVYFRKDLFCKITGYLTDLITPI